MSTHSQRDIEIEKDIAFAKAVLGTAGHIMTKDTEDLVRAHARGQLTAQQCLDTLTRKHERLRAKKQG